MTDKIKPQDLDWAEALDAADILLDVIKNANGYVAPENAAAHAKYLGEATEQMNRIAEALHLRK
jgi:hypothetical protein